MTKDDFLSKFSSDYDELNNIYNTYQIYIFNEEDLNNDYSNYCITEEPEYYLLEYILIKYNVFYEVINNVFDVDDSELEENIDIIHDSLDFSEMFSLYNYSVNVNINKLINSITDVLIDLKLYKEINIDRYYIESVINKSLPYKITTYETN